MGGSVRATRGAPAARALVAEPSWQSGPGRLLDISRQAALAELPATRRLAAGPRVGLLDRGNLVPGAPSLLYGRKFSAAFLNDYPSPNALRRAARREATEAAHRAAGRVLLPNNKPACRAARCRRSCSASLVGLPRLQRSTTIKTSGVFVGSSRICRRRRRCNFIRSASPGYYGCLPTWWRSCICRAATSRLGRQSLRISTLPDGANLVRAFCAGRHRSARYVFTSRCSLAARYRGASVEAQSPFHSYPGISV